MIILDVNKLRILDLLFCGEGEFARVDGSRRQAACWGITLLTLCHGVNLHLLSVSVGAQEVLIDPGMACLTRLSPLPVCLFASSSLALR